MIMTITFASLFLVWLVVFQIIEPWVARRREEKRRITGSFEIQCPMCEKTSSFKKDFIARYASNTPPAEIYREVTADCAFCGADIRSAYILHEYVRSCMVKAQALRSANEEAKSFVDALNEQYVAIAPIEEPEPEPELDEPKTQKKRTARSRTPRPMRPYK